MDFHTLINQTWPEWMPDPEPLGKGSFGTVYRAVCRKNEIERQAAVKVISISDEPDPFADLLETQCAPSAGFRAQIEDCRNEIELLMKLKNKPNIVSVDEFAIIEQANVCHILIRMELLRPLKSDERLSAEELVRLGRDICKALSVCESRNILHRDIKPENIFVDEDGNYKLGDFGVSRVLQAYDAARTRVGTPMYMAPEVCRGEEYTKQADIYSLGRTLYRLAGGRPDGFALPEKIPSALAEVIGIACREEAAKRFQNAEQFSVALGDAAMGKKVKQKKRRRRFLICIVTFVLLCVLLLGVFLRTPAYGVYDKLCSRDFAGAAEHYATSVQNAPLQRFLLRQLTKGMAEEQLSGLEENKIDPQTAMDAVELLYEFGCCDAEALDRVEDFLTDQQQRAELEQKQLELLQKAQKQLQNDCYDDAIKYLMQMDRKSAVWQQAQPLLKTACEKYVQELKIRQSSYLSYGGYTAALIEIDKAFLVLPSEQAYTADLQEYREQVMTKYLEDVSAECRSEMAQGYFSSAFSIVRQARQRLDDPALQELEKEIERTYVSEVQKQAASLLDEEAYSQARYLLQTARGLCPDNQTLIDLQAQVETAVNSAS